MGPKQLRDTVARMAPMKIPLYIEGPPGIGKSSVLKQYASEEGVDILDIRCLLHDPSDLKFPVVKDGKVSWVNSIFPADPDWKGIIALEEVDKCGTMMQGALLQPVLDRKIGEAKIPDGAWFVLVGNRLEDHAGGHELITPLRSRCVFLDLEVSTADWNEWALENDIDFRVRTYLVNLRPDRLFCFDPNQRSSPNPRSWEFVSHIRKQFTESVSSRAGKEEISALSVFDPIAGAVGEGDAAGFLAYCRIADNLPDVDKVLANPTKGKIPDSPEVLWALCGAIVDRAKSGDHQIVSSAFTFASRLGDEYSVMLGRDLFRVHDKMGSVAEAKEWIKRHRNVIIDANRR